MREYEGEGRTFDAYTSLTPSHPYILAPSHKALTMTHQLNHETLAAVRRALKAGARHTEIARDMDLAVSTIARIASDRRLRRRKLALLSEAELPEDDPPPDYAASRLRRCPGCGGMVYRWPCLACRLRGGAGVTECESAGEIGSAIDLRHSSAACGVTFEPTPSGVGNECIKNEAA